MIVVTGATGTIGRELLRLLAAQGAEVVALSRNPADAEAPSGITWAAADLADRKALPGVLAGAERLFLLTGNSEDMVPVQKNAIAAAQEAGVGHVVKLSALGASDHSRSVIGVWHFNVEQALQAAGLAWTILRPHVFMQNLLDQRASIQREGKIYSPTGEAHIPMIDTRDIAAVAAAALTEPRHEGKRYTLTGPAAISYREAAAVLSTALGKPVSYVPETYDEAWHRLRQAGLPTWYIGAQLALASYQRQGAGTGILTGTVEALTGRPPHTFQEFAHGLAPAFGES